jgi:hypothetical protein
MTAAIGVLGRRGPTEAKLDDSVVSDGDDSLIVSPPTTCNAASTPVIVTSRVTDNGVDPAREQLTPSQ